MLTKFRHDQVSPKTLAVEFNRQSRGSKYLTIHIGCRNQAAVAQDMGDH